MSELTTTLAENIITVDPVNNFSRIVAVNIEQWSVQGEKMQATMKNEQNECATLENYDDYTVML